MRPLRITMRLTSPVAFNGSPIHFDALLAFAKVHCCGRSSGSHPSGWEPDKTVDLPLRRINTPDGWFYRASAWWPEGARSRQFWTKKWEQQSEDLLSMGNASQIVVTQGCYKEFCIPFEAIHATQAVFYCVGQRSRINRLLKKLHHIGCDAASGWGALDSNQPFVIDDIDCQEDVFDLDYRSGDAPARNLPVTFCDLHGIDSSCRKIAPLTPPYWRVKESNTCITCY